MRIDTLLDTLADAIASNATLSAWATTTYGKAHKVFINMDQHAPPEASDAPFVVIYKQSKTEGQGVDPRSHGIGVRCAVNDSTKATPTHTNQTEYNGGSRLETMRRYTRNAVTGASMGNCTVDSIATEYGPLENFPWFVCDMSITILEDALIGVDPFE